MPASPPPDQPAPLPPPVRFDPTTLDLAVIAIPLLEKINEERKLIDEVRGKYPKQV